MTAPGFAASRGGARAYDAQKGVLAACVAVLIALCAAAASGQARSPDIARALSTDLGLQGRVMWVDGTANIARTTNREGVADIVARCKKANISTIVVDVKPVVGQVLYASKIAERLRQWQGKTYPDFDVLAAFVEEGHKAGIEIAASMNIFSEGHKYFSTGLAYRRRDWQAIAYTADREFVALGGARLPIRAQNEPVEAGKTIVYQEPYLVAPEQALGARLAVALDSETRLAGLIDPGLLGDEPLSAPEDGYLMLMDGPNLEWGSAHLRAGERARFEVRGRRVPVAEAATERIAAFVNPLIPEARAYEMSLLTEVVRNYNVDTIVFDRLRYANLYNDYSDLSRRSFESWLGKPVSRWPDDVIRFDARPGEPLQRGAYFKPWLEFRARVIRGFVRDATESLRAIKPDLQFGVYVGSWFSEYFGVGVNWGSERFHLKYGWAPPAYNEAGYAELLDWVSTGCYYPVPTRDDARRLHREEGATVEAAADLSVAAVQNAAPVYAGVYALDYEGRPEEFARAVAVASRHSQGVMIFDLSYIYDYGWWSILEQAFSRPAHPPHRVPDLTEQLRATQDAVR